MHFGICILELWYAFWRFGAVAQRYFISLDFLFPIWCDLLDTFLWFSMDTYTYIIIYIYTHMFPNQTHFNSNNALPSLAWHPCNHHPSVQGRAEGTAVGAADAEGVPTLFGELGDILKLCLTGNDPFCSCRYCVFMFFSSVSGTVSTARLWKKKVHQNHMCFVFQFYHCCCRHRQSLSKKTPPCKGWRKTHLETIIQYNTYIHNVS